jgi:hypothetical protein
VSGQRPSRRGPKRSIRNHSLQQLTLDYRYSARAKERTGWQKEKDKLHAQLKEVEGEIQAFTQEHEAEINTLMDEYMLLRQQASEYDRDFL